MSAKTGFYSTHHHPLGTQGLWHHQGWQLPAYIQNVAKGMMESGMDRESAIVEAIGTVRRWATGGGNVHPEVRAAAAKAIAEWDALKASTHSNVWEEVTELATPTAEMRQNALKKGAALPPAAGSSSNEARFPLTNRKLASDAVKMVQLAKPESQQPMIRRWLMKQLRAKGWADLIPSAWNADGTTGGSSGSSDGPPMSSKSAQAYAHIREDRPDLALPLVVELANTAPTEMHRYFWSCVAVTTAKLAAGKD